MTKLLTSDESSPVLGQGARKRHNQLSRMGAPNVRISQRFKAWESLSWRPVWPCCRIVRHGYSYAENMASTSRLPVWHLPRSVMPRFSLRLLLGANPKL
eukprot:3931861-Rhodomonas_salina.2